MKTIKCWIEAMRLRTLPVSLAGVGAAWAFAVMHGQWRLLPGILCAVFALLAQIASNFANEYFDFTAGRDRRGRQGPRRGVTEGDITPAAMRKATFATLGAACCVGLSLVAWSGWWLVAVGAAVAAGVFAYSTGPYPLSTNGWGEVAVIVFFGLVPVNLTYYLMTGLWSAGVFAASVSFGLMGANVLIINNYRDTDDDRAVGKRTLSVRWGRRFMPLLYLADALCASFLLSYAGRDVTPPAAIAVCYTLPALAVAALMQRRSGAALTPLLGITALLMAVCAALLIVCAAIG